MIRESGTLFAFWKQPRFSHREEIMPNVYVEPRPKGRPEGDPIEDYVVEDHTNKSLPRSERRHEAIDWAIKSVPRAPRRSGIGISMNKEEPWDHWRTALSFKGEHQ